MYFFIFFQILNLVINMHVLYILLATHALAMQDKSLEIAAKVAGDGAPSCTHYSLSGIKSKCMPFFYVSQSNKIDARSANGEITFTIGSISKLNDNEFALMAGHEIAHYYLNHTHSSKAAELEADKFGAALACKAGFDPIAGSTIFRFAHSNFTHPSAEARRAAVASVPCPRSNAHEQVTAHQT